jgi:hydroxyacylglutathione hydrolase
VKIKDLARQLKIGPVPCVVDVRSGPEFRSGHIPGAVHAPMLSILLGRARLPESRETRMVLTCEHGPRALVVKSILRMLGYRQLDLLEGHMAAWRKAGMPTE